MTTVDAQRNAGTSEVAKLNVDGDDVSFEDLKQGLADDTLVLVDVREPHEFAAGHIPGATLVPLSSFDPAELPRGKPIVFSCQTGKRSLTALRTAREAGVGEAVGHFAPGYAGWRAAGEDVSLE